MAACYGENLQGCDGGIFHHTLLPIYSLFSGGPMWKYQLQYTLYNKINFMSYSEHMKQVISVYYWIYGTKIPYVTVGGPVGQQSLKISVLSFLIVVCTSVLFVWTN